jgi:NAD(P)-dependent dehydrogenase (short-subunit alcohol dehydrogenase family)
MARVMQRCLVIGASSGIGAALVSELARTPGARIAAVARRSDALGALAARCNEAAGEERVLTWAHDVTEFDAVPDLLEEIARDLGGLDLVVYCAGVMHSVAFEEFDTTKDLEMLRVNLEGAVAWLNPVAERFARLGRGVIVGIGSVAGDRGRSGNPVYNTSKAGLHTYLEALRNRIHRTGARVVTIKPGFVDTPMTAALELRGAIPADVAARTILRHAKRRSGETYVPAKWRLIMAVIRRVPSWLFRRLKI